MLKRIGLEAKLLIKSPLPMNICMIWQYYQDLGSTCQSHRQDTSLFPHLAEKTQKHLKQVTPQNQGVDVSVDISHSFSGEHNAVEFVMWTLSLWAINSSSELNLVSQWLHLSIRDDLADTFSASSSATDAALFLSCLLLSSLLNWLGDFFFFFFPQELLTSSFVEKVKISLPIVRLKENLWLLVVSAWHNAKHFSTTSLF